MAIPTFNSFSLQDTNFISERIIVKGLADRALTRAKINRREGVKLLATEFGEKEITIEGRVIASSVTELQTLLDNLKKNLTTEEGDLIIEANRTFTATVLNLSVPDEHYSQTTAPFMAKFICSNPYAVGPSQSVVQNVTSGLLTFSGLVNISGTLFARPTILYTPTGAAAGNTNILNLQITHTPTGQTITISGFGSSVGLDYADGVTINYDDFTSLEGSASIDNSGAFSRWDPGNNAYTITVSGRFPGGTVTLTYQPRYL